MVSVGLNVSDTVGGNRGHGYVPDVPGDPPRQRELIRRSRLGGPRQPSPSRDRPEGP